jgi:hypothetical protein
MAWAAPGFSRVSASVEWRALGVGGAIAPASKSK